MALIPGGAIDVAARLTWTCPDTCRRRRHTCERRRRPRGPLAEWMNERTDSTNCRVCCRRCRPNDYGPSADLSPSIIRDVLLSVSLSYLPRSAFRLGVRILWSFFCYYDFVYIAASQYKCAATCLSMVAKIICFCWKFSSLSSFFYKLVKISRSYRHHLAVKSA